MKVPFPEGKFNTILADPPWPYDNIHTGGSMKSGAADKYETMSLEEIKALPISSIAEKNSVLFLWATVPMLPEALDVLRSWNYKYKHMLTWRKIMSLGMGWYFRNQCEHLLVGIRGNIKAFRCQRPNFIETKALGHSEKPEEFRVLIEEATKNIRNRRMIELFARRESYGWTCWGLGLKPQLQERLQEPQLEEELVNQSIY